MSLYLLKVSGSNEVENIFEWNGSGSLTAPSGYVFELYTSASVTNYSSSTALELFGGSFAGLFTGELSGSILLNGKTFDEVVNETKYGSLVLLSYSGSDIGLVSSSNGFIVSGSNIKMSLNNLENDKQYNYITTLSSSLSGSLSGSLTNSLLRFTQHAGSDKLEYFINSVEISSSGTSSYANLQVTELYNSIRDSHSTYSASVDIFEDVYYSQWFVDFDLYNKPIVGQVYVNGDKLEKTLNKTDFGMLRYDGYSQNVSQSSGRTYFRFNSGSDDYNDYYWWNNVSPTKIVLNEYSLWYDDEMYIVGDYRNILEDIIKNKLEDSVLTLRQVNAPVRYKSFKIKSGSLYERGSRSHISTTFYPSLGWGSASYELIDGSSKFSHLGQVSPGRGTDPYEWDGYFYLEVEQIATNDALTVGLNSGDQFFVDIFSTKEKGKRKEIYVLTSSIAFTIPDWVHEITMYAVGAGGGGGGGSNGYGHPTDIGYIKPSNQQLVGYEYVIGGGGGAGGSVSISKFDIRSATGKIGRGDTINILVGSGGNPGSGSRFADEVPPLSTYDLTQRNERTHPIFHSQHDKYNGQSPWMRHYMRGYTPEDSPIHIGKKGSSTQVFSPNGSILISAEGGHGGAGGYGTRTYFPTFHRLCGSHPSEDDSSIAGHNFGDYYVPGGGSSIKKSVGNEIRPGGHGGYGTAVSAVKQYYQTNNGIPSREYPGIHGQRGQMVKLNRGPNIPWGDSSNGFIMNLKLPYGHTEYDISSYPKTVWGGSVGQTYFHHGSTLKPTQLAPGGGGGGNGITWQSVDTRNFNDNAEYVSASINHKHNEGWPNNEVPNDFFKQTAARISGSNTFGYGGKYVVNEIYNADNEILFDDYDWDGIKYTVRVGCGADGGAFADTYEIFNTFPSFMTTSGSNLPNSNKSGSISQVGYGWGGGGGAATYIKNYTDRNQTGNEALYPTIGQNGGKGGNGVLILVLEQKLI